MTPNLLDVRQELANKAEREVMACIGCNDCLLACPLPQAATTTIAALNFAVLQPTIPAGPVSEFVLACTQCQQCVPVCPADLSRADMVLHNKIKIEDIAPDGEVMLQMGTQVVASGWTLNQLATHLADFALFAEVTSSVLRRLLLKVTLRCLQPNEVLCREGEYHERLYVVLEGRLAQTNSGQGPTNTRILVLGPGAFHGEMAVMANNPEQYTLLAQDKAIVIEIPKAALLQFMSQSPVFQQTMLELYRRRAVWTHATRSPILSMLPEAALATLINRAQLQTLQPGEQLLQEGAPVTRIYLVRNGFLKVSRRFQGRGERVLLYFREGDVFGVRALLMNEPGYAFTVSASTRAEVIAIAKNTFIEVLAQYPGIIEALQAKAAQTDTTPAAPAVTSSKHENTTQLHASWGTLLDQGVIQSHELLVIDQNRCTNCNNCVDACERRHGHSRLERSGLQIDNLLFPTACRHCEDPVCLMCSVNGIVRLPNGEIAIVEENCIGCGACAERCPYNNIQMHPTQRHPRATNFLQELWDYAFGKKETEAHDPNAPEVAVKCDLCAAYQDYACVTACPVGAAFRIDPVTTFGRNDLLIGLEKKK